MSKKQTADVYENVTPQLMEQVKAVLAEAKKHTYSVSRVFGAYNTALGKNDKPETCASCLRIRVEALEKWLKGMPKTAAPTPDEAPTYEGIVKRLGLEVGDTPDSQYATLGTVLAEDYPVKLTDAERGVVQEHVDKLFTQLAQYDDADAAYYVSPAEGATRYAMADGLPFDFTPGDEANKGTVTMADGSKAKAGTHLATDGTKLVVQANGNARLEVEDLT